jgi:hypothetical protein
MKSSSSSCLRVNISTASRTAGRKVHCLFCPRSRFVSSPLTYSGR